MINKLSLNEVSVSFGTHAVLQNLSGDFTSGKPNLIVGRAGSGKSTLLQVLAGFHQAGKGKVFLDDEPFVPEGNFSLVFQNPEALFFNATVAEEVGYSLKMRRLPAAEIRLKTSEWLQKWGLDPAIYAEKHPLELSGGEKRRVALAACTVFMPPVILLDEPLAGLDGDGQLALAGMLEEFARDHIVITVTHEPEMFLGKCNQILFLQENDSAWFQTDEFLSRALQNHDFYPLPAWYREALQFEKKCGELPLINAQAVFAYKNKLREHNADKL